MENQQPPRGNLLSNLWNRGELPTVNTAVAIDKASIDYLAVMLCIVLVIALTWSAIVKRVAK